MRRKAVRKLVKTFLESIRIQEVVHAACVQL